MKLGRFEKTMPPAEDVALVARHYMNGWHETDGGAFIAKAPLYEENGMRSGERAVFVGINDDMRYVSDAELAPLRLLQARWQRQYGLPVIICSRHEARLLATQPVIHVLPLLAGSSFVRSEPVPSLLLLHWLGEWTGLGARDMTLVLDSWARSDMGKAWRAWATVQARAKLASIEAARHARWVDKAPLVEGRRIDWEALGNVMHKVFAGQSVWVHHAEMLETDDLDNLCHVLMSSPDEQLPHEAPQLQTAGDFRSELKMRVSSRLVHGRYRLWVEMRGKVAQVYDLLTTRGGGTLFERGVRAACKALAMLALPTARQAPGHRHRHMNEAWPLLGTHGVFVEAAQRLRHEALHSSGWSWSWGSVRKEMGQRLQDAIADMRQRLQAGPNETLPVAVPCRFDCRQKDEPGDLRLIQSQVHKFYPRAWRAGFERVIRSWQW